MNKKEIFTKILTIVGNILVWFPVIAPVLVSIIFLIVRRLFRFDYLMPAELFPSFLVGSILLIWAAIRKHSHWGLICWSFAVAIISLVGCQTLAVVTGLASGETEPVGLWWILVLTLIIIYDLAVITTGIGGVLLLRDLFKSSKPPAA